MGPQAVIRLQEVNRQLKHQGLTHDFEMWSKVQGYCASVRPVLVAMSHSCSVLITLLSQQPLPGQDAVQGAKKQEQLP